MKSPFNIAALFCQDFTKILAEHLRSCDQCRTSIVTVYDQFPFFSMIIPREKLLSAMKGMVNGGNADKNE